MTFKSLKYPIVPISTHKPIEPRVEYSLTGTGKSLIPALQPMVEWALKHFDEVVV